MMDRIKKWTSRTIHIKHIIIFLLCIIMTTISSVAFADPSGPSEDKYDGLWYWPAANGSRNYTSKVGTRTIEGKVNRHYGLDIGSVKGSDCLAARAGTAYAYLHPDKTENGKIKYTHSSGNYVIIDHGDGYYTRYAHLNSINFTGSKTVKAGEKIGVCGWTGHVIPKSVDGTHLHFEIAYCNQGAEKVANYFQIMQGSNKWGDSHWKVLKPNIQNYTTDPNATGIISANTLEFRNIVYPQTYKINTSVGWNLSGGILVSNNELKTLFVKITKANGFVVSQMASPRTLSGKVFSISNLDGEGKDNGQKFSNITEAGEYIWAMTATDSAGKEVHLEIPFTAVTNQATVTATVSSTGSSTSYSETPLSGVYQFNKNDDCRSGPGESYSEVKKMSKGDIVFVVASTLSQYNYTWYKLSDGSFVYSGDVDKVTLTETSMSGQYKFTRDNESHVWPYEASTQVKSYSKGTTVTIKASVVNTYNNTWYRLSDDSYVWSGDVEPASGVQELQFSGVKYPTNYKIGSSNGYVLSDGTLASNYELKTITSTIYNASGTAISGPKTRNISGYSYSIKNLDTMESGDNGVKFSTIKSAGQYTWVLTATDSGNNTLTMEMPFTASFNATSSGTMSKRLSDINKPVTSVTITLGENSGSNISATYYGYNEDANLTLFAQVSPTNATNPKIKWTSLDEKVLKLNSSESTGEGGTLGTFTKTGVGSTVITATAQDGSGKKATLTYNYYISSISLEAMDSQIYVDETTSAIPTIVPSIAGYQDITWESSSPWVATVDEYGYITGTGVGSTVITATAKDEGAKKGTCTITVLPIPVEAIYLDASNLTLSYGMSYTMDFEISPYNATNRNVTWDSSNPSVATVSSSGVVTTHTTGTTVISATTSDGGKRAECALTVVPANGSCGDNVEWLYSNGTLTIWGTGDMYDYSSWSLTPWYDYYEEITYVSVGEGVTSLGKNAFRNCYNLYYVDLPSTLARIGQLAFYHCENLQYVDIPDSVNTIEYAAFAYCYSIPYVYLHSGVTSIPEDCFNNCTSLTSVNLLYVTEIGDTAFAHCDSLVDVEITGSIQSIGYGAFAVCGNLSKVMITTDQQVTFGTDIFASSPNIIVYCQENTSTMSFVSQNNIPYIIIGGNVGTGIKWFYYDGTIVIYGSGAIENYDSSNKPPWYHLINSFQSIKIYDGITEIGNYSFYGCNNATSVYLPSTLTSIGTEAFYCLGASTITIPASVTSIGEGAFKNSALTAITLPDDLQTLGRYAFQDCENLNNVTVRALNTVIGGSAFKNCPNLTLYCYEDSLFYAYANKETTNIPCVLIGGMCGDTLKWRLNGTVLTITGSGPMSEYGQGSFPWNQYMESITEIKMTGGNTITDFAFGRSGDYKLVYTSVSLPDTLTSIGSYAFYHAKELQTVNIPDSVSEIGENAFRLCTKLSTVHLPSSLTTISDRLFWHCGALTGITIPEGVTSIGTEAFYCLGASTITIPASVTTIGEGAFKNSALTEITLPDNLQTLDRYAFQDCENLCSVTVRALNTVIGGSAFKNCPNLTLYCYEDSLFYAYANKETTNIPCVLIGGICGETLKWRLNGTVLTIIGSGDMYEYERGEFPWSNEIGNITEINMTGGTTISDYAFDNDQEGTKYSKVTLPDTLTQIGKCAFYYNKRLTSITIPESVCSILNGAFRRCAALTEINIPNGVTVISDGVFYNCYNLEIIILPEGVTDIGANAFAYCTKLQAVELPNTLTAIGNDVFNGCTALDNIVLPDGLISIGSNAFKDCERLDYLCFSSNTTSVGSNAFVGCTNLIVACWDGTAVHIHVKANNIPFILMDTPINNPDFVIPTSTKSIEAEAFYGIAAKRIRLSEGVTSIGRYAFAFCPNLVGIYIPEGCTTIDENAFYGCTNLIIYSTDNSYAKTYANTYGFEFRKAY